MNIQTPYRTLRVFFFTLIVSTGLFVAPSAGLADTVEVTAQEIYGTVMSPFCPARLLNDCPSPSATDLKVKILTDLKTGKSKEQVLEELYTTFGSAVRAAPEAKGFGALAWWIPILFVVIGLAIYAVWLSRRRVETQPSESGAAPLPPEMRERIEAELNRHDS